MTPLVATGDPVGSEAEEGHPLLYRPRDQRREGQLGAAHGACVVQAS